jgi:hypothetical protein
MSAYRITVVPGKPFPTSAEKGFPAELCFKKNEMRFLVVVIG